MNGWSILICVISGFLLSACTIENHSQDKNVEQFIDDTYRQVRADVALLNKSDEVTMESSSINGVIHFVEKNPFARLVPDGAQIVNNDCWQPRWQPERELLSQFDLAELQFKGVIGEQGDLWALVQAPDASIHRIGVGQVIGNSFGRIDSISTQTLSITEHLADGFGCWQMRNIKLSLNK